MSYEAMETLAKLNVQERLARAEEARRVRSASRANRALLKRPRRERRAAAAERPVGEAAC